MYLISYNVEKKEAKMELHTWILYVSVALIAIISPGPAVLLAINNSVIYDLKATAFSTLGNVIGCLYSPVLPCLVLVLS